MKGLPPQKRGTPDSSGALAPRQAEIHVRKLNDFTGEVLDVLHVHLNDILELLS